MRRRSVPPRSSAKTRFATALSAPPRWSEPVGLGAKRTRTMSARYLGYRPGRTMGASRVRAFWLFAGATLVVLVVAASATGRPRVAATPAAAPFARAWASVPKTTAGRKRKRVLVFGQEQDAAGFNPTLTCCNQFWAGVRTVPVIRGAFLTNDKLQDRKSTRLNSSHRCISYAVFCLKK